MENLDPILASMDVEEAINELMGHECGTGEEEKDEDLNAPIGTKQSGYAKPNQGPFECEHCLHYTEGKDELGFCDNTHVLRDDELEDGKCKKGEESRTLKVVAARACCNYFKKKPKNLYSAAELPEIEGFDDDEKKELIEHLLNIPVKVIKLVEIVKADPALNAIHGRYDKSKSTIEFNPANFDNKMKFGTDDPAQIDEFVLAHEFGHALQESLPEEKVDEWKKLSGWMKGTKAGQAPPYVEKRPGWPKGISSETHSKDAKFVREYSKKNNKEDFADTCAYIWTGNESKVPEDKLNFIKELTSPV